MNEITMTIEQLKTMIERMENQEQYQNMKPYVYVSIKQQPNGKEYVEFEQPCHYAECNSTYYRYE